MFPSTSIGIRVQWSQWLFAYYVLKDMAGKDNRKINDFVREDEKLTPREIKVQEVLGEDM